MANILFYRRRNLLGSVGGVERVLVNLSNEFARKGHTVYLTSYDKEGKKLFFELDKNVVLHRFQNDFGLLRLLGFKITEKLGMLDKLPFFNQYLYRSKEIKNYCHNIHPDIIIASAPFDLIDIKESGYNKTPVILMLHGHPRIYFKKKRSKLFQKYINKSDAIQVLLPSYIKEIPDYIKTPSFSIGNFVNPISISQRTDNTIIYLASIVSHKGQDLLIKSFSKISKDFPTWQVHLWGDIIENNYFHKCKNLIKKYKLEDQVIFKGVTKEPQKEIKKAKICAFSSTSEGLPMSLIEMMSAGLPSIGFNSCPGVNELIIDGTNGFLAKDVDDFSKKLKYLLSDEDLQKKFSIESQKVSISCGKDKIINEWEALIDRVKN